MIKIEIEVSEKVAEFLNHPKLKERHMGSVGELIEAALTDALHGWTDDPHWGFDEEINEMNKEG